jgi:hypothetical protein
MNFTYKKIEMLYLIISRCIVKGNQHNVIKANTNTNQKSKCPANFAKVTITL